MDVHRGPTLHAGMVNCAFRQQKASLTPCPIIAPESVESTQGALANSTVPTVPIVSELLALQGGAVSPDILRLVGSFAGGCGGPGG